jgi:FHA domain
MARLQIHSGPAPAQVIELKLGTNRLGRAADNDFPLEDPSVSAHHCELVWANDLVTVKDLASTNGTFIGDRPVQCAPLQPGERLRLGDVELVLESAQATIAVPEMHFDAPPVPTSLADGSPACLNHSDQAALFRCTQCERLFCDACVRELRRVGGVAVRICPACSGRCEPLPGMVVAQKRSPGFIDRLRQTWKLVTRRGPPS